MGNLSLESRFVRNWRAKVEFYLQQASAPSDIWQFFRGTPQLMPLHLDRMKSYLWIVIFWYSGNFQVTLSRPQIKPEEEQQVEYMENDAEIILEKVEEEQNAMLSDDSEDEHNSLLDLNVLPGRSNNKTSSFPKAHEFQADNFNEVENWR